jgi:hypothetical protein
MSESLQQRIAAALARVQNPRVGLIDADSELHTENPTTTD